jgi:hypothetical protein
VQNREELRQIGHDRSRKTACHKRGKKYPPTGSKEIDNML